MARVPDATQKNVEGLKWFKIQEDGLSNGVWGVNDFLRDREGSIWGPIANHIGLCYIINWPSRT